MSKNLIENVANATGITQSKAKDVLGVILDEISNSLQEKEDVNFYGFGKFTVQERAARKGRNPATGESINIPSCSVLKFKPSSKLKKFINE